MEIAFVHYRSLDKKTKKVKEGYYTLLALSIGDSVVGVMANLIPESVGKIMRNFPEKFNEMPMKEAIKWIKDVAPEAYRKGWRSWPIRKHKQGLGAMVERRLQIGQKDGQ